jgi:N-methylhydantoinase A
MLSVGPRSAGARPGPACYGRGGTEPTVTDADVVLGYLDPETFLGGEMPLDREAAREAIRRGVAEPLGLDLEPAAAGVFELVNVSMAAGVREVSVRRGLDPRDFPIVVAGGAGPVHAAAIARELEIPMLLVPRESSIFCAAGMLVSDFQHDDVRALKRPLAAVDARELAGMLDEMAADGRAALEGEGVAADQMEVRAAADLRYVGQWHEIAVSLEWSPGRLPDLERLAAAFHLEHDRLFGYAAPEMAVECLAARVASIGHTPKPDLNLVEHAEGDAQSAARGRRPAWSPGRREMVETPVFDGHALGPGAALRGPAIVELATTTIVVGETFELVVDRFGSFILHAGERGHELVRGLSGREG